MNATLELDSCAAYGVVNQHKESIPTDTDKDRHATKDPHEPDYAEENTNSIYCDINPSKCKPPKIDCPKLPPDTERNSKKLTMLLYLTFISVIITTSILVAIVASTAAGFAKISKLEDDLKSAQIKPLENMLNNSLIPVTNTVIISTDTPMSEAVNYTSLFSSLPDPYLQWINILTRNTVLTEMIKNCVEGDLFGNSSLTQCIDVIAATYGTSELIPAASCEEIRTIQPANSGYYWVTSSNRSSMRVYCEMTLTCANKTGGPTRSAGAPMSEAVNYTSLFSLLPDPYPKRINILTRNTVLTEIIQNCGKAYLFDNSSLTQCIDVIATTYGTSELIPAASCEEIHTIQPANSGYYWVTSSNGSSMRVYCEMALTCANKTGGLTRAFILNSETETQYCTGDVNLDEIGCFRTSPEPGCSEISFPLLNIPYSHVCGIVCSRWFGHPDGYSGRSPTITIDDNYVDGISLTYNTSLRTHLWTFIARRGDNCTQDVPNFVGTQHSCLQQESCVTERPMFIGQFHQPVPRSIEVRLCQDQPRTNYYKTTEGLYLRNLEIYVW